MEIETIKSTYFRLYVYGVLLYKNKSLIIKVTISQK